MVYNWKVEDVQIKVNLKKALKEEANKNQLDLWRS
jgi:hypothetical protein